MKRFFVLVLAMSGLIVGQAFGDKPKGYTIALREGRIGTTDVERGEYKILVHRDEMKAEVMDVVNGDIFEVTAKVKTADSKYQQTEVSSKVIDGVRRITEIRIGGTPFRVNFPGASAE